MKKNSFYATTLLIGSFLLGGCSAPNLPALSSFTYKNSDKYTMGEAELPAGEISNVEIDWVSGEINVAYHTKDTVIFSETSNKTLNDKTTMYYFVDGDTLHLKFAKSGNRIPSNLNKELTVYLPEGMELDEVAIDSVSADVNITGLTAEKTNVDTISGNIVFEDVTLIDQAKFDTTSGDITANLDGNLTTFSADTISGNMECTLTAAKKVEINSTSGELKLTMEESPETLSTETVSGDMTFFLAGAEKIDLESINGNINLSSSKTPDAISVDTVSGDVVFCLPENSDFTVNWDSASGSLNSDFAMKKEGASYIFGAGTNKYDMDTTSGDLSIEYN